MRLLVVNVFFDPNSFGGATIIAEEMASRLHKNHGFDVQAVSIRTGFLPCNSVVRHATRFGFDALNIGVSNDYTYERSFSNVELIPEFRSVVDYYQPDVVHVHCVQKIGAAFFDVFEENNIPFVVTVHDHWWNCDRQFMIDVSGNYCMQTVVDPNVCSRRCVVSLSDVQGRLDYLQNQLNKSRYILVPSEYFRNFLGNNGFDHAKLVVNKNGVEPPSKPASDSRKTDDPIVFGYVGGPGHLKGWTTIVQAFRTLGLDNYEIQAVDAGALINASWRDELLATSEGLPVKVIPPYRQDSIDQTFEGFDALLMPSNWRESFGLTAREALLRDVWVIASDAGGLAEDIVDGENGRKLPFPPRPQDLAAAIVEVRAKAPFGELPHKDRIVTLDAQAEHLAGILHDAIA